MGIPVERLNKLGEGSPHVVDKIEGGDVVLVINTPTGTAARTDGYEIRRAAIARGIPCITTITGGMAAARAIAAARHGSPPVRSLQEIHRANAAGRWRRRERPRRSRRSARRRLPVVGRARASGAYVRALGRRRRRAGARPRAVRDARRRRALGRGRATSGRSCRGRSPSPARHDDGTLDFVLEDVGPGTERLCELEPGDDVWLLGPLGRGFAPPRDGRRPVLVGGGVGIAPLMIWQDALGAARRSRCSASATRRTPRARRCCRARAWRPTTARSGTTGSSRSCWRRELGAARVEVYACGPPPMLEAVRALCAEHDVPAQLALESGMACGFGACFGCVVPTRDGYVRLCVDGPVLEAADARGGRRDQLLRHRAGAPDRQRARARSTRSPPGARSATRCSTTSRSPRSSPRRSRSRRARATRRRGCGSSAPG